MGKESLKSQVNRLANFIMTECEGYPNQSEGAIDCAIRIIRAQKEIKFPSDEILNKKSIEYAIVEVDNDEGGTDKIISPIAEYYIDGFNDAINWIREINITTHTLDKNDYCECSYPKPHTYGGGGDKQLCVNCHKWIKQNNQK